MRMSGLLGAAIDLSALTPIAPAHAYLIAPWQLMETDLFLWPDWREILGKYDCTMELNFYLWNAPPSSAPVVITPPSIFDPVIAVASGDSSGEIDPSDPIGTQDGDSLLTAPVDSIGTPGDAQVGDTPSGRPAPARREARRST